MPDSLVEIHGTLRGRQRSGEPNVVVQQFVARHTDANHLADQINAVMRDIFAMGGMLIVRDQKKTPTHDNLRFIPLINLLHLDYVIRQLSSPYPDARNAVRH